MEEKHNPEIEHKIFYKLDRCKTLTGIILPASRSDPFQCLYVQLIYNYFQPHSQ